MKRAGLVLFALVATVLAGLVLLGKHAHAKVRKAPPLPTLPTMPAPDPAPSGPDAAQVVTAAATKVAVSAVTTALTGAIGAVSPGAAVAAVPAIASVAIPVGVAAIFTYNFLAAAGLVGKSSAQMLAEARAYADTSLVQAGLAGEKITEIDKATSANPRSVVGRKALN